MIAEGIPASGYSVFGLRVRSSVPLPELLPAIGAGATDVSISSGRVAISDHAKPGINADEDGLLLIVPEVARFRIRGGAEIIIDAEPNVPERNVRLFLLGSAFGALLHQRGMLPLHANAIEIGGHAVAFMGASGAGKSTLAAWFHDRGHRIIADDVCVAGFDGAARPFAAPGLPRLRLWRQALELMGREASGYHRSYVDPAEEFDKFDVPIASHNTARDNVPLAGLYLLDGTDRLSVSRMNGVEAAEAVFANTYRGAYVSATGGQRDHWLAAVKLVRTVPVYRVSREWDLGKLDEQYRKLLQCVLANMEPSDLTIGPVE